MANDPMFFDSCPHLVIRGDFSLSMDHDHKVPSGFSCTLVADGKTCPHRGACVTAKSHNTGRPVGAISRR